MTEDGRWELVDFERPANAIYRCRHDAEGSLYAFLPSFCPANKYGIMPNPGASKEQLSWKLRAISAAVP
ncbi:hypothetical protein AVDCRST_MAG94-3987 [uncultured Leptolyngbya sp.]|uniref:Uncharacterized protein n=1 Tax=uncultured Leptolyngbya sp. TaxID=332963 RepID=A0A6J4MU99_9CYAN|nr:hypothetical protein AVDCRST_MAG94-3987 [uncultured Leptolyngbya sp.]